MLAVQNPNKYEHLNQIIAERNQQLQKMINSYVQKYGAIILIASTIIGFIVKIIEFYIFEQRIKQIFKTELKTELKKLNTELEKLKTELKTELKKLNTELEKLNNK
jgi:uncharacterized membrane protein (DUF106 family)